MVHNKKNMFIEFIKKNHLLVSTLALVLGIASMSISVFKTGAQATLGRCEFQPQISFEQLKLIAEAQGCKPEEIRIIKQQAATGLTYGGLATGSIAPGKEDQFTKENLANTVVYNDADSSVSADQAFKYFTNAFMGQENPYSVLNIGNGTNNEKIDTFAWIALPADPNDSNSCSKISLVHIDNLNEDGSIRTQIIQTFYNPVSKCGLAA